MRIDRFFLLASVTLLFLFTLGMLVNLGNIAFWEDEGETVQYGRSILKFGYPSVFDGRSFILLDENYHRENYLRYTSPWLQFYVAAFGLLLSGQAGNTFLIRLPFALAAIAGAWGSWFLFRRLRYSPFVLFLYSAFLSTSVQLYLNWRQARHYALQYPLMIGLLTSYLSLGKRWASISFVMFGFLFYHAYYLGFFSFYLALMIHAFIRKLLDHSYRLKPFVLCTMVLISLNLPALLYLHHYGQLTKTDYAQTFLSYLMDINYDAYLKIVVIALLITAVLKKKVPDFRNFFQSHQSSLSLLILAIGTNPFLASFSVHHSRYMSIMFPFGFLVVAETWRNMTTEFSQKFSLRSGFVQIVSFPLLFFLMIYSHPGFVSHLTGFVKELQSEYYGPIEGIVNTIEGKQGLATIDSFPQQKPDLLIATNFEDGAIYAYLDNQFVNYWAPIAQYRDGERLPDWVIVRTYWPRKEYVQEFLEKGNYERIETEYCDLQYENLYLVRTHNFQTVTDCPEGKLTLHRLMSQLKFHFL